jgi:hypothetical protein
LAKISLQRYGRGGIGRMTIERGKGAPLCVLSLCHKEYSKLELFSGRDVIEVTELLEDLS